jgi:hypothetical protein
VCQLAGFQLVAPQILQTEGRELSLPIDGSAGRMSLDRNFCHLEPVQAAFDGLIRIRAR